MITPKTPKPTPAEEAAAYELATLRDGGRCVMRAWDCSGPAQRDHRKNRSQGGRTVPENLQLLCMMHHQWKTDNSDEAARHGWAVPGWGDPLTYPGSRWVREPGLNIYRHVWVLYVRDRFVLISDEDAQRRIREGVLYEAVA